MTSEPEILSPSEVAAIESGYHGLVPLDGGPGGLKALDLYNGSGGEYRH
jgi:hypothetical protein